MREATMLHQLSGASRVDDSNVGLHENVGRAWISVGRQARRIEQQIEGRARINFTDAGTLGIGFQHGDCVRGLAGIREPEKREIVFGRSDLVDFGIRKQRGDNCRRRLAVVAAGTRNREEAIRVDGRLAVL